MASGEAALTTSTGTRCDGEALALRGDDLELRLGDGGLLGAGPKGSIAGERLEAVPI